MTVFLGTLWSSIKQIKAPHMFDGELGIALHAMQGNQASSHGEEEVSYIFSSCGGNLGYILELRQRWPFKTRVSSATTGLLSSYEGKLRNLHEAWQGNKDDSRGEAENEEPFQVAKVILELLSIFNKTLASLSFEALNTTCLSRCQRDLRPPVRMRLGPRSFSRISTGYSDIPSSCEMKDGPAFKPLQGNPPFFQIRASRCTFHCRQQNQGASHIRMAEGSLLLRCLWKVGIPL